MVNWDKIAGWYVIAVFIVCLGVYVFTTIYNFFEGIVSDPLILISILFISILPIFIGAMIIRGKLWAKIVGLIFFILPILSMLLAMLFSVLVYIAFWVVVGIGRGYIDPIVGIILFSLINIIGIILISLSLKKK